jgi:hypothetical protein
MRCSESGFGLGIAINPSREPGADRRYSGWVQSFKVWKAIWFFMDRLV